MRGYYFQGLSTYDWQKQQPVVHPVLDYDKRFNGPGFLGGEFAVEANVTSLTREAAQYQQVPNEGPRLFGLYETCTVFERGQCLVRGISGTTTRASVNVSWRRQFIDSFGQTWTPFTYMRADGFSTQPDFEGYQNAELRTLLGGDDDNSGRLMPAIGLEYRFPLIASLGDSRTQIFEPIAQVIARPNETRVGRLPNEDAQSLVFEDTSIFEWNKFSGYDRVEGGVRANLGAQYTVTGADGLYANALVGQSVQLAGRNSYRQGDLANVGRDSGLESARSDYVTRLQFAPNRQLSFFTRGRFDQDNLELRRIEAGARTDFNPWLPLSTSVTYARYEEQPELGYPKRREGVLATARLNVTSNWYLTGSVLVDLDRYLDARQYRRKDEIKPNSMSVGIGYIDECTTFSVSYSMTPREVSGTYGEKDRNQTVLLSLELRTLGQASLTQRLEGDDTNTRDR
jgi:LPS-assembly protein